MYPFIEKKEKSVVFSTLSSPPYYSNPLLLIIITMSKPPPPPLIIPTPPIIRDSRVLNLPYSNDNAGNSKLWFQLQSYKNETDFRCI